MDDARLISWDISICRYERSGMQDSDGSWPQELDGMQWMLGWTADLIALIMLEQCSAGQEDVNKVSCYKCPNRIRYIPSRQTPTFSYRITGQTPIKETGILDQYPLDSNTQCSRRAGTNVHT